MWLPLEGFSNAEFGTFQFVMLSIFLPIHVNIFCISNLFYPNELGRMSGFLVNKVEKDPRKKKKKLGKEEEENELLKTQGKLLRL